jgi:hypothetical protein
VGVTIESYGKVEISYIPGQVRGPRKERRKRIIIIIIRRRRNGAKTISLPNFAWEIK